MKCLTAKYGMEREQRAGQDSKGKQEIDVRWWQLNDDDTLDLCNNADEELEDNNEK